jgi:hypothetical protein
MTTQIKKGYEHQRDCVRFIDDAAAYIRHALEHSDSAAQRMVILGTLIHDITGLANRETCFLPRVTGYDHQERA